MKSMVRRVTKMGAIVSGLVTFAFILNRYPLEQQIVPITICLLAVVSSISLGEEF